MCEKARGDAFGLVLQHAARHPALLVDGGSAALIAALHECGLIDAATAAALAAAHADLLARAIRCTLDARPRVVARDADIERATDAVRGAARRCGFDFDVA